MECLLHAKVRNRRSGSLSSIWQNYSPPSETVREVIMKSFDVKALAAGEGGEYVLGMKDLGTHACYLIYGTLKPGETGRLVKPGSGHEEILCAIVGKLLINGQKETLTLETGHAVHVREDESFEISNPGQEHAVYVMAGGHVGHHH